MRRQPVRIPSRRSAGDIVIGIGAVIVLIGLVFGVPAGLMRVSMALFGAPFPTDLPSLTAEIGPQQLLVILVLLVWIAWLQLASCVLVEVYAGIRQVGLPARVPGSSAPQWLAHRLVTAALLLFTASAVVAPIVKAAVPHKPPVAAAAMVASTPVKAVHAPQRVEQGLDTTLSTKKVYVVEPPAGRHHESLWEIAEKCLGDGRRYADIFALNKEKLQPDGTKLKIADLIRPGWVLDMPKDAVNVHIVPAGQSRPDTAHQHPNTPADGAAEERQTPERPPSEKPEKPAAERPESDNPAEKPPEQPRAEKPPEQPEAERPPEQSEAEKPPGQPEAEKPEAEKPEAEKPAVEKPEAEQQDPAAGSDGQGAPQAGPEEAGDAAESGPSLSDYFLGASLAAAGLLVLLGRRRREQLWHRAAGRRIARPEPEAAEAETALRIGADPHGARMLDAGLRELAKRGSPAPTVYGAHLSAGSLDLWIHPPDTGAPAPWTALDGGRLWRLPATEGRRLENAAGLAVMGAPAGKGTAAAAPYPGLVTLGRDADGDGRILVDLEAAHGIINIVGPKAKEALAAVAVELATNRWSDDMRLLLVGFGEDLAMIAPERIRTAETLHDALPELEERAARATRAMNPVMTGRAATERPTYLLCANQPSINEQRRLAKVAKAGTRLGTGYLVAGEVEGRAWTWEITEDGRARIDVLGFDVQAQLLPEREYAGVIELFRTAARRDGDALPTQEPIRIHEGTPAAEIRILGPVEVTAPGRLEEARLPLATEIAVYLATHPGGVHPSVLTGAIWPRGVQPAVRDAALRRVKDWLGTDGAGEPNLVTDSAGRLHLGPEVRVDWPMFSEFVRRAQDREASWLDRALELVRGPLLAGRPAGRYAWLATSELEFDVTARVADAAHRLCELRLEEGDPDAALVAVRAGLLLALEDEILWRDLLRATADTGDSVRLRAVVDAVQRRSASHPYGGGMPPETEALIEELLPTWRLQVVNGP